MATAPPSSDTTFVAMALQQRKQMQQLQGQLETLREEHARRSQLTAAFRRIVEDHVKLVEKVGKYGVEGCLERYGRCHGHWPCATDAAAW